MRKLNDHRDDDSLEVTDLAPGTKLAVLPRILISVDTSRKLLQTEVSRLKERDEVNIARLEQVLKSFRSKARHFHAQHELPLDQTPASSFAKEKTRSYNHIRMLWRVCKAVLIALVLWVCIAGQPLKLAEGLYQGVVFGWDSECKDGWTCR
jgi:hypothetical protein